MNKMKRRMQLTARKLAAFAAVMMMVLTVLPMSVFAADTAGMSGKGTKASPYIVTTAEQLNAVRNDLKAHYKLGNTIDLSGYANWKPIGSFKTPFRGTFTCDTNADGTPKYIIKNLKMYHDGKGATKAEKYSGYKDDGSSGWELGLFGKTNGATLKNIVVWDANIESKCEGSTQMNGDKSINPGQDDMPVGILVASAEKTTIDGCGVKGTVVSNSNATGGLVGQLQNGSKAKNSYSYASVTSTGTWGGGGFAAAVKGSTVDSCFFDGFFHGGYTHKGAFAGDVYGTNTSKAKITNCWAAGTAEDNPGSFLGIKYHEDTSMDTNVDVASRCYTLVKQTGYDKVETNTFVINDLYVADEPGILEVDFAVASKAKLNEIFGAWTDTWVASTTGGYPQLKNVHPITDASAYVPNAVTADAGNSTTANKADGGKNTTTSNGETVTEDGEVLDETAAGEAVNNINIDVAVEDGVVQLGKKEAVVAYTIIGLFALMVVTGIVTVVVALVRTSGKKGK